MPEDDATKLRREGSMLREVLGTFFGVAPYVMAMIVWGANVQERMRVTEIRLDHAEAAAQRAEANSREQRSELVARLEKIAGQIERLQESVAARK